MHCKAIVKMVIFSGGLTKNDCEGVKHNISIISSYNYNVNTNTLPIVCVTSRVYSDFADIMLSKTLFGQGIFLMDFCKFDT